MGSVVFGCGSFFISYWIFGWLSLVGELIGFVIFWSECIMVLSFCFFSFFFAPFPKFFVFDMSSTNCHARMKFEDN